VSLELFGIDLHVEPNAIERRFLDGVSSGCAPKSEWDTQPIDFAIITEVEPVLDPTAAGCGSWISSLPRKHHRQMRLPMDEKAHRQVGRALRLEHIGHSLRRFGLSDIREFEWIRTERARKHTDAQPCEILFD